MSVYEKWLESVDKRDAEIFIDAHHEDYQFIRHQSGTTMNKSEIADMMRGMMANDDVVVKETRCLYENDDVLVMHSIVNFPDGTSEAIIQFSELKDGKIIKTETGATLIADQVDPYLSCNNAADQIILGRVMVFENAQTQGKI